MTRTAHRFRAPLVVVALALGSTALFAGAGQTTIEGAQEAAPPPLDTTKAWPCVQGKIEKISVTQIWDGPSIDGIKGWYREQDIVDLIDLLSNRRVTIEEAESAIKKFADAQPADKRDERLTFLFAGLFDKIASQRRTVMSGIEKYQKSQIERSKELERQSSEIAKLEGEAPSNESVANVLDQAHEKFNWAQRIFQERQSNIPLACELPVLIEERLYALSRSIRSLMKS